MSVESRSCAALVLLATVAFWLPHGAQAWSYDGPPGSVNLCINYLLRPPAPLFDFPPYRLVDPADPAADCADWGTMYSLQYLNNPYELFVYEGLAGPMLVPFSAGGLPAVCTPTQVSFCGVFANQSDADFFVVQVAMNYTVLFADHFAVDLCPTMGGGYRFDITTNTDASSDSGTVLRAAECSVKPQIVERFPSCKCDARQGTTPLYVQPAIAVLGGRRQDTALYCFTLGQLPENYRVASSCNSTRLLKVEIAANWASRAAVKGIRVTPSGGGGASKWVSASWGPLMDFTLKVTPLNWSMAEAIGGEVCLELPTDVALNEFCLSYNARPCFLSLFTEKRDCCPIYTASIPTE